MIDSSPNPNPNPNLHSFYLQTLSSSYRVQYACNPRGVCHSLWKILCESDPKSHPQFLLPIRLFLYKLNDLLHIPQLEDQYILDLNECLKILQDSNCVIAGEIIPIPSSSPLENPK